MHICCIGLLTLLAQCPSYLRTCKAQTANWFSANVSPQARTNGLIGYRWGKLPHVGRLSRYCRPTLPVQH